MHEYFLITRQNNWNFLHCVGSIIMTSVKRGSLADSLIMTSSVNRPFVIVLLSLVMM
jgi:hypothetical protein